MTSLLDPPPSNGSDDKDGPLKKHAKTLAIIGALVTAVYGAAKPEAKGQQALTKNKTSYDKLRDDIVKLQKWSRYNHARAKRAEQKCKAEVSAVSALVTGFMFGSTPAKRKAANSPAATYDPQTLQRFIKALQDASVKGRTSLPEPPALKAPPTSDKALK